MGVRVLPVDPEERAAGEQPGVRHLRLHLDRPSAVETRLVEGGEQKLQLRAVGDGDSIQRLVGGVEGNPPSPRQAVQQLLAAEGGLRNSVFGEHAEIAGKIFRPGGIHVIDRSEVIAPFHPGIQKHPAGLHIEGGGNCTVRIRIAHRGAVELRDQHRRIAQFRIAAGKGADRPDAPLQRVEGVHESGIDMTADHIDHAELSLLLHAVEHHKRNRTFTDAAEGADLQSAAVLLLDRGQSIGIRFEDLQKLLVAPLIVALRERFVPAFELPLLHRLQTVAFDPVLDRVAHHTPPQPEVARHGTVAEDARILRRFRRQLIRRTLHRRGQLELLFPYRPVNDGVEHRPVVDGIPSFIQSGEDAASLQELPQPQVLDTVFPQVGQQIPDHGGSDFLGVGDVRAVPDRPDRSGFRFSRIDPECCRRSVVPSPGAVLRVEAENLHLVEERLPLRSLEAPCPDLESRRVAPETPLRNEGGEITPRQFAPFQRCQIPVTDLFARSVEEHQLEIRPRPLAAAAGAVGILRPAAEKQRLAVIGVTGGAEGRVAGDLQAFSAVRESAGHIFRPARRTLQRQTVPVNSLPNIVPVIHSEIPPEPGVAAQSAAARQLQPDRCPADPKHTAPPEIAERHLKEGGIAPQSGHLYAVHLPAGGTPAVQEIPVPESLAVGVEEIHRNPADVIGTRAGGDFGILQLRSNMDFAPVIRELHRLQRGSGRKFQRLSPIGGNNRNRFSAALPQQKLPPGVIFKIDFEIEQRRRPGKQRCEKHRQQNHFPQKFHDRVSPFFIVRPKFRAGHPSCPSAFRRWKVPSHARRRTGSSSYRRDGRNHICPLPPEAAVRN